jgi:hypothetical protein
LNVGAIGATGGAGKSGSMLKRIAETLKIKVYSDRYLSAQEVSELCAIQA